VERSHALSHSTDHYACARVMGPQSVVGGFDGSTVGYSGFLVGMVPGGQVDEGFTALRLRGIGAHIRICISMRLKGVCRQVNCKSEKIQS